MGTGDDEKAMGARFTNDVAPDPVKPRRKVDYTGVFVIGGIVVFLLVIVGVWKATSPKSTNRMDDIDEDTRRANAEKNYGGYGAAPRPATPAAPGSPTIHMNAKVVADKGADTTSANVIANMLIDKCLTRSVGTRERDAWAAATTITVGRRAILIGDHDAMMWSVGVKMDDSKSYEIHRGNTLWFDITDDKSQVNPSKEIAGKMCGVEHGTFTAW